MSYTMVLKWHLCVIVYVTLSVSKNVIIKQVKVIIYCDTLTSIIILD